MPRIIVVLYWLWLIGAAGVLCYRIYARLSGKRARVLSFSPRDRDGEAANSEPTELMSAGVGASPVPHANVAASSRVDATAADDLQPSVLAAMRADGSKGAEPAPSTATSGGLFSAGSDEVHQPVPLGPLAPLRETLHGIEMPCDLVPVTELGPRAVRDSHRERLVLATTTSGAGEVAARLVDELQRLDLTISATSPQTCVARRADHAVEVRVHEFPDRLIENGAPSFPAAPTGAVVVEFLAA
ncbi:MAG: hypothetical protein OEW42_01395 [Acidimicrobiia bacterium]|nr:hypothetical protein [Acidimicrobiia bacterium]